MPFCLALVAAKNRALEHYLNLYLTFFNVGWLFNSE
jgi:hypothetical protein